MADTINKITIGPESRYIEDEFLSKALKYILGQESQEFDRSDANNSVHDLHTIDSFIDNHNKEHINEDPNNPRRHLELAERNRPKNYLNGNATYVEGFSGDDINLADDNSPVLVSGLRNVLDEIYKYLGKTGSNGPITFQIV